MVLEYADSLPGRIFGCGPDERSEIIRSIDALKAELSSFAG